MSAFQFTAMLLADEGFAAAWGEVDESFKQDLQRLKLTTAMAWGALAGRTEAEGLRDHLASVLETIKLLDPSGPGDVYTARLSSAVALATAGRGPAMEWAARQAAIPDLQISLEASLQAQRREVAQSACCEIGYG